MSAQHQPGCYVDDAGVCTCKPVGEDENCIADMAPLPPQRIKPVGREGSEIASQIMERCRYDYPQSIPAVPYTPENGQKGTPVIFGWEALQKEIADALDAALTRAKYYEEAGIEAQRERDAALTNLATANRLRVEDGVSHIKESNYLTEKLDAALDEVGHLKAAAREHRRQIEAATEIQVETDRERERADRYESCLMRVLAALRSRKTRVNMPDTGLGVEAFIASTVKERHGNPDYEHAVATIRRKPDLRVEDVAYQPPENVRGLRADLDDDSTERPQKDQPEQQRKDHR